MIQVFLQLGSQWRCKTSCRQIAARNKTSPLCNFFGLTTIAPRGLHSAYWCSLSRNVGTRNPFQVAEVMLQSWAATCNALKTISAMFAERRTKPYFVQPLQALKSFETSWKEDMLHAATYLQLYLSCNAIAMQVAKSIPPSNTNCTVRFYFL